MVSFLKHINKIFRQHNKAINQKKKLLIEEIKKISLVIKNLIVLKKNNNDTKFIKALITIELNELRTYKKTLIEQKKMLNSFKLNYCKNDEKIIEKNVENKKKEEVSECPICLENIRNEFKLDCDHKFCKECIERVIDMDEIKCPMCRNITYIRINFNPNIFKFLIESNSFFTLIKLFYDDIIVFNLKLNHNNYYRHLNFYQNNNYSYFVGQFLDDFKILLTNEIKNNNFDIYNGNFENLLKNIRQFKYCYNYNDHLEIRFSHDIRKMSFNSIDVDIENI